MKKTLIAVPFAAALALAACASNPPAETAPAPTETPAAPPATAAPTSAPAATAAAEAPPEKPKEEAAPPPLNKPKSAYQVGGKSLSEIEAVELLKAFQKAKLVQPTTGAGGMKMGQYETINFSIDDGKKLKGTVYLIRPTPTPIASGSTKPIPPAEMHERRDKNTSFFIHDPDGDVFISVEMTEGGKAADAKKILSGIVKKGK